MKAFSIPPISDEELMRRYLKTKPVVNIDGTKYWLRNYTLSELKSISYIWYARTDKYEPVGESLSSCTHYDFKCLHTYGFPGFFKPSISEILAQIPEDVFENYSIDAFEIIDSPATTGDFNKYRKELNQGFHVSIVRLYVRTLP